LKKGGPAIVPGQKTLILRQWSPQVPVAKFSGHIASKLIPAFKVPTNVDSELLEVVAKDT
jgi:hypothetical protein